MGLAVLVVVAGGCVGASWVVDGLTGSLSVVGWLGSELALVVAGGLAGVRMVVCGTPFRRAPCVADAPVVVGLKA